MGNVIYGQLQYYEIYYGLKKKKKIPDIDIAQNIQKKIFNIISTNNNQFYLLESCEFNLQNQLKVQGDQSIFEFSLE